jgi:hypothetical protein
LSKPLIRILKSIVQKAVRRREGSIGVKAFNLLFQCDSFTAVRRLPIIVCEDIGNTEIGAELFFRVVGDKKTGKLSKETINLLYSLIVSGIRNYPYYIDYLDKGVDSFPLVFRNMENCKFLSMVKYRLKLQGLMDGDNIMLRHYYNNIDKYKNLDEHIHLEEYTGDLNFGDNEIEYIAKNLSFSIDPHCSNILDFISAEDKNLILQKIGDNNLSGFLWRSGGGINNRICIETGKIYGWYKDSKQESLEMELREKFNKKYYPIIYKLIRDSFYSYKLDVNSNQSNKDNNNFIQLGLKI